MSWYSAHILTIIIFLPLWARWSLPSWGASGTSIRWVALLFTLLTFLITVCLYSRFDPHRGGMQFTEFARGWFCRPSITTLEWTASAR